MVAAGMLLSIAAAVRAHAEERIPIATTPPSAFYSDLATNLNDALIAAGAARNDGEPELFHSGAEEACFGELAPSARSAWDRAVDHHAEIISPADSFDRQQYLIRGELAGFGEWAQDARARRFVEIARAFRTAASPAYEECRWAAQDAENRRWIEELKPRLAAHETTIARRLEELYQKRWTAPPIPSNAGIVRNGVPRPGGPGWGALWVVAADFCKVALGRSGATPSRLGAVGRASIGSSRHSAGLSEP
jgi:hypothetical protein